MAATDAQTYAAAQAIVAALAQNDNQGAFAAMAQFTGADLTTVANKAMALGADPNAIQLFVGTLNTETIEVTGTAPDAPVVADPNAMPTSLDALLTPTSPWLWAIIALGAVAVAYSVHKSRHQFVTDDVSND